MCPTLGSARLSAPLLLFLLPFSPSLPLSLLLSNVFGDARSIGVQVAFEALVLATATQASLPPLPPLSPSFTCLSSLCLSPALAVCPLDPTVIFLCSEPRAAGAGLGDSCQGPALQHPRCAARWGHHLLLDFSSYFLCVLGDSDYCLLLLLLNLLYSPG